MPDQTKTRPGQPETGDRRQATLTDSHPLHDARMHALPFSEPVRGIQEYPQRRPMGANEPVNP